MNIAVYDIGTNSIHMLIAKIRKDGTFRILDREKDATRLGDGSFEKRRLKSAAVARGLHVIEQFHELSKEYRVERSIGVATSAVRDAKNGKAFIRSVKRRTGIEIRIVSGNEEALLIERAARSNMDVEGKKTLVIDIGGGSMELIVGDGRTHDFVQSFPLGVARLTDRFLTKDPPSRKQLKRLDRHIEKMLGRAAKRIRKHSIDTVIGTAGTLINLGSMAYEHEHSRPLRIVHHTVLERDILEEVHEKLCATSLKERLNFPGLDAKRSDIIVAGSILVRRLMRMLRIERILISKMGIREGVILEEASKRPRKTPARRSGRILAGVL